MMMMIQHTTKRFSDTTTTRKKPWSLTLTELQVKKMKITNDKGQEDTGRRRT